MQKKRLVTGVRALALPIRGWAVGHWCVQAFQNRSRVCQWWTAVVAEMVGGMGCLGGCSRGPKTSVRLGDKTEPGPSFNVRAVHCGGHVNVWLFRPPVPFHFHPVHLNWAGQSCYRIRHGVTTNL